MIKLSRVFFICFFIGSTPSVLANSYSIAIHNNANNHFSLPLIGIRINGGLKYTNDKHIEVEIKSLKTDKSLIEFIKIGFDPDLSGSDWQPYTEAKLKMQLDGEDGEKRVYVQLKDKAGNSSPIESNKIIYDTTPPQDLLISINKGEKFTNDKLGRVLVNVKAEDADQVMLSNSAQFQNGRWEPYKESIKWIIEVGSRDGEKIVYAKFSDLAGNESESISSKIILDVTPPTNGSIVINDGGKYTRSKKIELTLTAKDATLVRIVSRGVGKNFDFVPDESGKMEIIWNTDSLQGNKSVKAYFMDEAKNTTKIPAEASINYNKTPPVAAQITIDQGRKYTNNPKGIVALKILSEKPPQNLKMFISNKPNFDGAKERSFVPFITNWQLDSETDGLKSIYIKLIDQAGNISKVAKTDIFLDRSAPTIVSFSINEESEWSISLKVMLNSDVDDAFEAQYSNNSNNLRNTKWEVFNEQRPDWTILAGDGLKNVYGRYKDEAGNISEVVSAKIMLDMTPPKGKLIINDGTKRTNHSEGLVNLQIQHDEDVIGMQITNVPDFTEVKLLPLQEKIENWKLEGDDDGPKTVFIRLKDKAGNFSKIYSYGIILDRTPPTNCDLVINNNDSFVRNRNKRVSLSLRAEGANYMQVANSSTFPNGEWIPFKTAISWTLEGPEGVHNVYVKYKDAAGNESDVISKTIKSDFAPPKIVKITIGEGTGFTTDSQNSVTLHFDVEGAVEMAISNNHINDTSNMKGQWEPYKTSKEWRLEGEDGPKIVYSIFKDEAGNLTKEYQTKIELDRIPPIDGKISINNDAEWLTDKSGKGAVFLYAKGAHEVMISNSSNFSNGKWEPMTNIKKDWKFETGQPSVEIFVKFRDKAGNISEPISATIKMDIEPPTNASISIDDGAKFVTNKERKVTIGIKVNGATGMRISESKIFSNVKWEAISTKKELSLTAADGEKTIYAQFSDDAGNQSEIVSSKIILDTTPPKIKQFTIDDGAEWTNNTEKKVKLSVNASGAHEMMISDNPGFGNSSWQSFNANISNYELKGEDGEKVLFIKLRDEVGNVSKVVSSKINLKRSF